ncbi:methylated-DNA-[protein]-cysteine S-methyltransferase [Halorubrum aquaticum]|uniref:Methylated-DNA-[protein]-cysteine S-methyltransferase n=1 Tax=Halorubrum aquaticum TaxID=387340 RepID=A0A1I2ZC79_9EURY|nr:MGMT family protein [Halorubrum aquaticum]SFH34711.1 methylated-DNA-[protein]-cysteine S-methyltransferase [Halorubrum aquaticum]
MATSGTSGVFAREYDAIGRAVEVGFAGGRAIAVSFPGTVPDDASSDHDLLDRIGDALDGEPESFDDVEVGLTVPTDQRRVLEALRELPVGESASVSRLTRLVGLDDDDAEDLELVTRALRENPLPVILPDHRVEGGPYATPGDVRSVLRSTEGI